MTVDNGLTADAAYDHRYYQKRGARARRSADVVMPLVCQLIHPRSVVDVGCATGSWLAVAKAHGVAQVLGLDLEEVPRELLEIDPAEFLSCDLRQPIDPGRTFDLVLALEVAEHLPEASAAGFLDLLTRLAPVVLFSAAIPFQGGTDHYNEQWPAYWAQGFLQRNYVAIDCLRAQVWNDRRVLAQYAQNLLLFVNRDRLPDYPALAPSVALSQSVPQWPLHLVHPLVLLKVIKRLTGRTDTARRETERAMAAVIASSSDRRPEPIRARHKTRVCFATTEYPPHPGGAARSARRLVQGLAAEGFDVTVFSAITGEFQASELPPMDGSVPIRWVPFDLDSAVQVLTEEDRRHPFDLFHGFTLKAAVPCLDLAALRGRPLIASIRGIDGLAYDAYASEVLRRSHWITSVSGDSLTRAASVADVSHRSCVIPNGIHAGDYPAWSLTEANRGVVGTVATFRVKKNIPLLIRAYASLPRTIRQALLLVGDAYEGNAISLPGRRLIQDAIDDTGVRAEVVMPGLVEYQRLPEFHARMRVFALSSDHEGMPNSIIEAAASGVPIVSTAVDGVKDIFTDGVDALLVPPQDAAALAAALARVLTDEDLARRLSAAARARAARLSVSEELRQYVALYERLR